MTIEMKSALGEAMDRIESAIGLGAPVRDAADEALESLIANGNAERLLRDIGPRLLVDEWEARNRDRRSHQLGTRKVDPSMLSRPDALLEALWPIGGAYKRLGSLSLEDCLGLRDSYARSAADLSRKAKFFDTIASKLEGGQVVSDVFTEDRLRELHEASGD